MPSTENLDDERFFVIKGRRWRRQDPAIPQDVAAILKSHLGRGRSAVGAAKRKGEDPAPFRRRVGIAKHGLGERGVPWWEQAPHERRRRWERALAKLEELDAGEESTAG
ncbi:MAG: 2-polyprenylphenol hydroxylase [Ornithinimicrobium sp.]